MQAITVSEAHATSLPLVDVREPGEWDEVHAPGATHIPLGQLVERLDELPESAFGVICHSGGRSARAVDYLASLGLPASNVDGGMSAWEAAGLPVERGATN